MTIDPRAVTPLLPFLNPGTKFYEPCAGDGDLTRQLVQAGMVCTGQSDITPGPSIPQIDALDLTKDDLKGADYIITNPPWDRKLLHPLIQHLSSLRPTWLLFDADWAFTKQSKDMLPRMRRFVAIGRLIWIPGTTMTGKDNAAWYLFDTPVIGPAEFYGRT